MDSISSKAFQHYWCVNCGYVGDFGFARKKNIKCQDCEYDDLTPYDASEYSAELDKRKEDSRYKGVTDAKKRRLS